MIKLRSAGGVALLGVGLAMGLAGCAEMQPKPYEPSKGHIQADTTAVETPPADIPEVVTQTPVLPEPEAEAPLEKYTVVVNEVPVKELLFALARDADLNVDLYPGIEGTVTLNAIDQTLPQILDRISRQVDIRYEFKDNNIIIQRDNPYFKSYKVDYVNMARSTTASNQLATQISTTGAGPVTGAGGGSAGSGGGNNNSTTDVQSISNNIFWRRLVTNIAAIINEPINIQGGTDGEVPSSDNIVATPETGTLNVRATEKQHEFVEQHIARVVESAQRQVVIQATILEVQLFDEYQAGINWSALDIADSSISITSTTLGDPTGILEQTGVGLLNIGYSGDDLDSTIQLLEQFGNTNVLSSPQLMVLNNQTAILKAVENFVYFEIEAETTSTQTSAITTVDSEARTVPVGVVMAITPQISDSGVVTLNVRPTVSDFVEDVPDPAIGLIRAQINQNNPGSSDVDIPDNNVPQLRVREMESMLRLNSGQTAILGGLMQNRDREADNAIPGLSKIPLIGRAFETKTRRYEKSELVIFLRPVIVNNPSVAADLKQYQPILNQHSPRADSRSH